MPEFHDYSIFVKTAYLISTAILVVLAAFCHIQLKNNEAKLKKIEQKKKTKN